MEKLVEFLLPSPLEKIMLDVPVDWYVKRDDLIHPLVSGNKYRKLKYIIRDVLEKKARGILTFGGSFSNHIHAVSACCAMMNLPSVGVIRGEWDAANPTLQFANRQGMKLFFVSRDDYRKKQHSTVILKILNDYSDYYTLAEGGDHPLADPGVAEIISELEARDFMPDYLALSAGTGATAAALIREIKRKNWPTRVLILTAVLDQSLPQKIAQQAGVATDDFIFMNQYALGGYAKTNPAYLEHLSSFYKQTDIPLDPIYNGKVVFGIQDLIRQGYFKPGTRLVWLHTGGLQGIEGFNYRRANKQNVSTKVDHISH